MSLYKDYLEERTDIEILEREDGFATYSISGEECYIRDIFVVKEKRNQHAAASMANEISDIAISRGCKYLTGTVSPTAKGSDVSLKVLMAYGMKLYSAQNNLIIFKKDIV